MNFLLINIGNGGIQLSVCSRRLSSIYSDKWNNWLRSDDVESVESVRLLSVIFGNDVFISNFSNVSERENGVDEEEVESFCCELVVVIVVAAAPSRLSIEISFSGNGDVDIVVDARGMMIPFEQRVRTNGQWIDKPSDNSRVNSSSLSNSTEETKENECKRMKSVSYLRSPVLSNIVDSMYRANFSPSLYSVVVLLGELSSNLFRL